MSTNEFSNCNVSSAKDRQVNGLTIKPLDSVHQGVWTKTFVFIRSIFERCSSSIFRPREIGSRSEIASSNTPLPPIMKWLFKSSIKTKLSRQEKFIRMRILNELPSA
jgi:hypothetical protein